MAVSLDIALSGQIALARRLETIANNVANVTTAGFRSESVKFESLLSRQTDLPNDFATLGDTYVSRRQGPLQSTDNPLDVAVDGDGWFSIDTPQGTAYTRDGRLEITVDGQLQTVTGFPILDAGGAPLSIDPAGGPLAIARDGMISQSGKPVGAIGLFAISENARLLRLDGSAVIPDRQANPVLDFTANGVMQGYIENSNVNPVAEMTRLIEVSRAFDNLTRTMSMREATLQNAIRTLGETS